MPRIPLRLHSGTPPAPTPDPEGDKDWRRAHRPRPPPWGRSATRLAEHPPTQTQPGQAPGGADTRSGRAPSPLRSGSGGGGASSRRKRHKSTQAAPACHLQSRPVPATPPSEPSARASAVPWSRFSTTSYPSRGNHGPHRPATRPSTIPAAREVRAAPPSSCGLGLRRAEGTWAGPCLRTSTKEGCDARAAQPAQ